MINTKLTAMTALSIALIGALLAMRPVSADPQALAQKSGCLACHRTDLKFVGPAFKDIAVKYKGDGAANADLADKIIAGGRGVWGPVPMPANRAITKEDANALVEWILQQ